MHQDWFGTAPKTLPHFCRERVSIRRHRTAVRGRKVPQLRTERHSV